MGKYAVSNDIFFNNWSFHITLDILSKKIGCKTYLSLSSPFLCKNWLVHGKISGSAILKINYWIFSRKIVNSFHKVFENVTILIFSYFLASKPFSHVIFLVYMLYLVIFKVTKVGYTMCKLKHWQKPEKNAILARLCRDIEISKKFK